MKISPKYELLIFFAIVLAAAGLRFYHLGHYGLWMDEIFQVSLQTKAANLVEVIHAAALQNQPPLDYIIGHLVLNNFPFSEFTARFPAFLFGTATVAVTLFFTRKLFNFWTAVFTGFLLSLSPVLIYFAQEARPYSIFLFFMMGLLALFFGILESAKRNRKYWFLFIVWSFLSNSRFMGNMLILL